MECDQSTTVETARELELVDSVIDGLKTILKSAVHYASDLQEEATTKARKDQEICFSRKLPDDILSLIFEFASLERKSTAHRDCRDIEGDPPCITNVPVRLSHASRQFRSLALRLPKIWTVLSTSFAPMQISTYLTRSRNASLTIVIGRLHTALHWETFVRHVVSANLRRRFPKTSLIRVTP